MKILYLMGRHPAWSETFVRQELEMMLAAGVPLLPVALHGDPNVPLADGTAVQILAPEAAAADPALSGERPAGIPGWLPWRDRWSLWRHRHLLQALLATARAAGATHLHAAWSDLPGLLAAAAARRLEISYSLDAHAHDVHCQKYPPGAIFGAAAFVAVCNRCAQEQLQRLLQGRTVPLHYLPHGLRLSDWPMADPLPWQPGRPLRLLFAGRLVPKKGADSLIPALSELSRTEGLKIHLTVVGDGPLRPLLESQAESLGLGASVSFAGIVDRSQVPGYFRFAHLLLAPGCRDAEGDVDGIPNVVLEAMASGLPVVATEVGGLGEVVTAATAYPATAATPDAVAAAIREFCQQGEVVALKKAMAARALVEKGFDAEKILWKKIDLLMAAHADGDARRA